MWWMRRCCPGWLLLGVFLCGCGGKYDLHDVEGTVTLKDGTPLADLRLMFECEQPPISAMAATDVTGISKTS